MDALANFQGCMTDVDIVLEFDMANAVCGEGNGNFPGNSFVEHRVGLNPAKSFFTMEFEFMTTMNEGMLLLVGDPDFIGDHINFEVIDGKLEFEFAPSEDTDTYVCDVKIVSDVVVNDGKWHTVSGERTGAASGRLTVDGVTTRHDPCSTALCPHSSIDTAGEPLYIGGHPDIAGSDAHTGMDARTNFLGCLSPIHFVSEADHLDRTFSSSA
jgi:hypothetical protein